MTANRARCFSTCWALSGRESGAFDALVLFNLDRFGRNDQKAMAALHLLADLGARPTSPARRSATGASATSTRSSPRSAEDGLDPATDVTLVAQNFDMVGLLDGTIDAAEAMTYNEYAQVLEAVNPDTGELYTPDDLTSISYEDEGVGMLQDAIWADAGRLADDPAYKDQATRFVAASIQGWVYCRDNPESCADIVTRRRPDARRQPPAVA